MSCESCDFYKSRIRELEAANSFLKKSGILAVKRKIEYIRDERAKLGLPIGGLEMALEAVRSELIEF